MMPRLAVTVVCLAVYVAGCWLPLPLLDTRALHPDALPVDFSPRFTFLAMGFAPFITGFLIVELFSLLTTPGRRLRRDGIQGRRKLNVAALAVSSVTAIAQAFGIAMWIRALQLPSGGTLTSHATWVLALTMATATFATAGLAGLISRYGLGNGFAVLFGGSLLLQVVTAVHSLFTGDLLREPETKVMNLIWVGLLTALVVAFLRRRPTTELTTAEGESLTYRLPPLPQGLVPVNWGYACLSLVGTAGWMWKEEPFQLGYYPYYGSLALVILALSALCGWMFSARPRVEANLEGVASVPVRSYDRTWRRQLLLGTLLLVAGEAGLLLAAGREPDLDVALITVATLLPLTALTLDLVDTARLAAKAPLERVITLDNVHLAELFRAKLDREGIECVVTTFRFRRLAYFLGPLFKMALLVPEEDLERAERLVEETPFRIV
jgi:hypothetical protein